jgi:hypothetical protein
MTLWRDIAIVLGAAIGGGGAGLAFYVLTHCGSLLCG